MRSLGTRSGLLFQKKLRRLLSASAITAALLASLAGAALGQTTTGAITGTVTDPQGRAVAGATVVVHSADTGVDLTPLATTDAGVYTVALLPPGNYDVTVSQMGFASQQHKGVTVEIGGTIRLDFAMTVATQQSLVTVTTEVPTLETEKTEQSQTVSETLVSDLPISSRRWEQFALLTPGVAIDGASGLMAWHGINSTFNNNSVDGANNNNTFTGTSRGSVSGINTANDGYIYSSDSIREFQVASTNYTAEVGQSVGGAVNAVTRSGTSQTHGDLFYNMRNPIFNALDPYVKATTPTGLTPEKSVHQQNQFGGSLGGPIIKDKLFYFVTYDGYRKVTPIAYTTTTPESALSCPAFVTTNQCADAENFIYNTNEGTFPRLLTQEVALAKLDYQINEANHVNVVFNWRDWYEPVSTAFASNSNSGETTGVNTILQDRFIIATWNRVIGGSKVNQLLYQYGVDNLSNQFVNGASEPEGSLTNLFAYGQNLNDPTFEDENRHQLSDTYSWQTGKHQFKLGADANFIYTSYRTALNFTGTYTYSTGVPVYIAGVPAAGCASGAQELFCDWLADLYGVHTTNATGTSATTGTHYTTYTSFNDHNYPPNFNGLPPSTIVPYDPIVGGDAFSHQQYGAFFEDTWKARPNLTLNLGIRYDLHTVPPPTNPNTSTPLTVEYTSTANIDFSNVQPRIGFAWNLTKNSVLRGGFGVFNAPLPTNLTTLQRESSGLRWFGTNCYGLGSPSSTSSTSCFNSTLVPQNSTGLLAFPDVLFDQNVVTPFPTTAFSNPNLGPPGTPGGNPLVPVVLAPTGNVCIGNPTCGLRGIDPNIKNPRAFEGELAYERQFSGGWNVSVNYVLTAGTLLPAYWDANLNPPTATKTYQIEPGPGTPMAETVTVPFFAGGTGTVAQNRPDPTVGSILALHSVVDSWYNGGVFTVRKQASQGLELLANYTLSTARDDGEAFANSGGEMYFSGDPILNPFDLHAEWARSGIDVRNRFTASIVWAPPYAKKLRNQVVKAIADGWSIASTITASDGTPYSAAIQTATAPCLIVATPCPAADQGINGGMTAADVGTGSTPEASRAAWLPRESFTMPSYTDIDVRLTREFTFRERYHFEFRAEAFNLFNSTIVTAVNEVGFNYSTTGPCAGAASATYTCIAPIAGGTNAIGPYQLGAPTQTTGPLLGARQMQFGLRFEF